MEARVNGINLFYKQSGQGSALIMLHGNGEDHRIFDALSERMRDHFTLYALDSRNHGKSDVSDDYAYDTMAKDLGAFIGTLNLAPTQVLGFSDGAIIALLAALQQPITIKRLALLGINLSPNDFREDVLIALQTEYEKTKDPLVRLMLEQPEIELSSLKNLPIPTLVIAGENDIFKPETFSALIETLPQAKYLIMKGHDHDSYISNNDLLFSDLLSFFDQS